MMSAARRLLFLLPAVLVMGCDGSDPSDQDGLAFKAESALVADARHGLPVLLDRLHKSLKFDGNAYILEGDLVPGSSAVSKNAAWTISCGNGVTIYFEHSEIDLVSAQVAVGDAQCAIIDSALGKEIRAIAHAD